MITIKDVNDWMIKIGEDPICDGPYYYRLTTEQKKQFFDSMPDDIRKIVEKQWRTSLLTEDAYNNVEYRFSCTSTGDECGDEIIKIFVDFLNKNGMKNYFKIETEYYNEDTGEIDHPEYWDL